MSIQATGSTSSVPNEYFPVEQCFLDVCESVNLSDQEKHEKIAFLVSFGIPDPLWLMDSLCQLMVKKGYGEIFLEGIQLASNDKWKNQLLFTLAKKMGIYGDFKNALKAAALIEGPLKEATLNWIQTYDIK